MAEQLGRGSACHGYEVQLSYYQACDLGQVTLPP